MKGLSVKLVASALLVSLLALPADLSAQEARGADVVVIRLDGSEVSGELIAVRPDALLLLENGRDVSVPLADVRTVRVVKKSLAGEGALDGLAVGGLPAAFWAAHAGKSEFGPILPVLSVGSAGIVGAIVGAFAGSMAGRDEIFAVPAGPEAVPPGHWDRLRAHSLEGRRRERWPRFRLSLSVEARLWPAYALQRDGSFGFPDEAAPESGPYPISFYVGRSSYIGRAGWGPVSLSCDWAERWSAEISFHIGSQVVGYNCGLASFTSTVDGKTYTADDLWSFNETRYTEIFAGLVYRPLPPAAGRRFAAEIGAAAGPAWVRVADRWLGWPYADDLTLPVRRKVVLAGSVRAAIDYRIAPGLTLGAYGGYRILEATLPGAVGRMTITFESDDEDPEYLERLTEVAIPAFPVKQSGAFWGLRTVFHF
jgi:hypothetical protein